ncbi:unnamed protein product, partial [marine sediment metagenome]
MQNELTKSIEEFVSAVERTSNLTIVHEGQNEEGNDILVIENSDIDKTLEGHQCEVDVSEIFAVVKDCRSAQEFIDVINLDRKGCVLDGVTRIVGYYSRTANWNKSKIGELRDRQKGNYTSDPRYGKKHAEATMKAV